MKEIQTNRRQFLKYATATAAGVVGFPYFVRPAALGKGGSVAASNRIVMGCIGTGGRGTGNMRGFMAIGQVQVVAVSDVDTGRRDRARATVNKQYGNDNCATYNDFRDLLARDDIDAVSIGTPDHWHGLNSIFAAKAGKDIYCEKPLVHTIGEGRALVEAVQRYGRVLQTGSQERSGRGRFACELVRNGRIGKLHTIRTYLPAANKRTAPQPPMPVLEGFDYDMWLGPAPWAPYTRLRCHGNFRWNRDYSDGELTDRGAHVNDIALWGAGPFLKGPVEIEGRGEFPTEGLWNTAIAYRIRYSYANGIEWILTSDGPRGVRFEGTKGWIFVHIHGARMEAEPKSLLKEKIGPDEIHLHESTDHRADFLQAIKTRGETVAPVEAGHATATFCHLGNIALLLGRKLTWDPEKELFINDSEANRRVWRSMRSPWRL
jgi:predicted dehydrogenase